MLYDFYAIVTAIAAMLYAATSRFLQNKLGNRHAMKAHQEEMQKLSKDYDDAKRRNDKKKLEELTQKQMEMLPKMNKLMLDGFKPTIPILAILISLSFIFNMTDPSLRDDLTFNLTDSGKGCDLKAGDGIYSGCATISGNPGTWAAIAREHESSFGLYDSIASEKYVLFDVGNAPFDNNSYYKRQTGSMNVSIDKASYAAGEEIKVYVTGVGKNPTSVTATLNGGTSFYVDLPFAIPVLNVQRIHEPYWWLIFMSFVSSPFIAYIFGMLEKRQLAKGLAEGKKDK